MSLVTLLSISRQGQELNVDDVYRNAPMGLIPLKAPLEFASLALKFYTRVEKYIVALIMALKSVMLQAHDGPAR
jgi:hypothetical protein